MSVAAEHAASSAAARAAVGRVPGGRDRRCGSSVVVGLPPGSRHELGALAFAAALCAVAGVGVLYLGSDVTVDGWIDARRRAPAREPP